MGSEDKYRCSEGPVRLTGKLVQVWLDQLTRKTSLVWDTKTWERDRSFVVPTLSQASHEPSQGR